MGLLRPLADNTVTTLGANGFISDKLMAANWASIWNIKYWVSGLQHLKEQLPEMKINALGYHEVFDELMGNLLAAGFDGYWNKYDIGQDF